ncbi:MAG: DUF3857 domain-containing protein, partial [Polyangiaceae bacterium]|nr:DUF3857 domain-containing protein [Polyangiaceae bacterium]
APMLSLRIADARGAPTTSLEAGADPAHAEQAAANAVARAAGRHAAATAIAAEGTKGNVQRAELPPKRNRDPGTVRGPVQLFERATQVARPSPDQLEAYAKYLLRTGGEDPTKHVARDLALRAANQGPTVDRCLLAAKLAEDRNQTRHWVEEAARLAGATPNTDVLLAQARLARSGPNWRDAVPYYDRALAIDPNHFDALLGRVDLFNEAGLRRTALGMLESALVRNPRAVGLLRAYTLQLASLERRAEAEQAQDRYEAYRFDDRTSQIGHIELAIVRRDKDLAKHWIDRLVATDPGASFHLSTAARSYLALRQTQEALAAYQQALAIAPEDTDMMVELAELFGRLGQKSEQMRLLRQVLVLRPQFKDVREYVEHIEPQQQRADEAYAWEPEQFLPLRHQAAGGFNRRTLRDLQVTTVYPSGLASRFHQVVFQPLNDEAAAAAREYAFVYQADRQSVQLRAGRVFRADGRVDEAIESAVGPADNPAIAMYSSARTFYVQFPRLEVGDVVELRYRVEDTTPDNAFADYFGEVAYLQSSEPLRNAKYVIIAPSSRPLYFHVSPIPGLKRTDRTQGDTHIYQFTAADVAPLAGEPKTAPWGELLGHVHASTYKSWNEVGRWYWGLAKEQINPDDEVRRKAEELTRGMTDPADKVRAIYAYVVQKTRYVALEFGIYGYKPRRAAQTFARGWGDCKDKAALIVSMLGVVGIPAHMVIVRSSMRGRFPSEPASVAPFDHAIAYVPSLDLYLDGTAEYTGSAELSSFIRGSLGLIVTPDGSRLVTLPDPPADQTQRNRTLRARLRTNGSADLSMDFEATGAIAAMWRSRYHAESSRRDRVAGDVSTDLPGFAMSAGNAGLSTNDLEDIEQPVRVKVQGSAPNFARVNADSLSVSVTPRDRFVRTYASLSQRTQDLVLPYRWSMDETWSIQLPTGAQTTTMLAPKTLTTPFGALTLTVTPKAGKVVVHTTVRFDKSRVTPAEYPAFVKFCEEIDRALAQKLIVSK